MTVEFLESLGLENNVIKKIFAEHGKTIEKTKAENEKLEAAAVKSKAIIDDMKSEMTELLETSSSANEYKTKYEAAQSAFDTFKKDIEAEKTTDLVYGSILTGLKDKGFSKTALEQQKFLDMLKQDIRGLVPTAKIENGDVKNIDDLTKPYVEGLGGFFGNTTVKGINPASPAKINMEKSEPSHKDMNSFIRGITE